MNIDLTNRMYKIGNNVYIGTCPIPVKEQRGRLYVNYRGKQINLKDIPSLPVNDYDSVYNYIFGGCSVTHPCPAMDYWIYRHRMGNRISTRDYKIQFKIKRR